MHMIHQAPPLINEPRLDELIASMGASAAELLPQILTAFCSDFETRYAKLQQVCRKHSHAELAEIIHDFKNLAQSIGWAGLSGLCRDTRIQLQDNHFIDWETLPARIHKLYTASLAETQRLLENRHLVASAAIVITAQANRD